MRILVIGAGGREHALVWRLSRGGHELHAAPGNPGIAESGRCHPVPASDPEGLAALCSDLRVDLVVPGPEGPLAAGISDLLTARGIPVFGPPAAGARIESSKWFAKEIMQAAGVPTAPGVLCSSPAGVCAVTGGAWSGWVLKDDGLAAGKGVFLPRDGKEADQAFRSLFPRGDGRVVVEKRLSGVEVSMMALCSGTEAFVLTPSRDHKRAFDGDEGPNTGGMGAVCPAPRIPDDLGGWALEHVFRPVLAELGRRGVDYRGALYAGLMLTPEGPSVLEFNCRFGDPETQAVLPLLQGDAAGAFLSCAEGRPDFGGLSASAGAAACVVMASAGYPGECRKGFGISGLVPREGVVVFHSGTGIVSGRLVTAGGRVLGVTGLGSDLGDAIGKAYGAVAGIAFEGAFWRRDIGRT